MWRRLFTLLLLSLPLGCLAGAPPQVREPIVGLPCEGCEAVFEGMPATLASHTRIAPIGEPGTPLVLEGTVRDARGRPQAGVIVYAYHTNARGLYPTNSASPPGWAGHHGLLRGWARTDVKGRYRFDTIRPGAYPGRDLPEHIHLHVIEPGRSTYYIDDVMFLDDPKLTPAQIKALVLGRGGSGLVRPVMRKGTWWACRDIVLGERIPGYARHGGP